MKYELSGILFFLIASMSHMLYSQQPSTEELESDAHHYSVIILKHRHIQEVAPALSLYEQSVYINPHYHSRAIILQGTPKLIVQIITLIRRHLDIPY